MLIGCKSKKYSGYKISYVMQILFTSYIFAILGLGVGIGEIATTASKAAKAVLAAQAVASITPAGTPVSQPLDTPDSSSPSPSSRALPSVVKSTPSEAKIVKLSPPSLTASPTLDATFPLIHDITPPSRTEVLTIAPTTQTEIALQTIASVTNTVAIETRLVLEAKNSFDFNAANTTRDALSTFPKKSPESLSANPTQVSNFATANKSSGIANQHPPALSFDPTQSTTVSDKSAASSNSSFSNVRMTTVLPIILSVIIAGLVVFIVILIMRKGSRQSNTPSKMEAADKLKAQPANEKHISNISNRESLSSSFLQNISTRIISHPNLSSDAGPNIDATLLNRIELKHFSIATDIPDRKTHNTEVFQDLASLNTSMIKSISDIESQYHLSHVDNIPNSNYSKTLSEFQANLPFQSIRTSLVSSADSQMPKGTHSIASRNHTTSEFSHYTDTEKGTEYFNSLIGSRK